MPNTSQYEYILSLIDSKGRPPNEIWFKANILKDKWSISPNCSYWWNKEWFVFNLNAQLNTPSPKIFGLLVSFKMMRDWIDWIIIYEWKWLSVAGCVLFLNSNCIFSWIVIWVTDHGLSLYLFRGYT